MPVYSFICPKCGVKDECMRAMKNAGKRCMCTSCGAKMNRDLKVDASFISGDYHNGAIHSDSLAISPDQRTEHEQKFPDIKLDNQNRPVFDNFQNHQAYLDKCNIVKERKKVKSRTRKRIA
ncbi:hypothetical protein KAR91_43800 [Candidatus Pacearchaeota archaeon]|nr:hypothetical protein [Candidatus Pacearchaeota archaeon]